ncbi:MAG TPA: LPS export ABC transporter periplasmic protein LptC [Woeseiaceae bacterium]
MRARDVIGTAALAAIAAGTWYLSASLRQPDSGGAARKTFSQGFYLRSARILGMGEQGNLLYEILADYAVQKENQEIELRNVEIRYSPASEIPWVLNADTATVGPDQQRVILSGHVHAVSEAGESGQVTEVRTPYLELEPERYRAETDEHVRISIGTQSVTATGMLALLEEGRLELKSNVSGRFVP